MTNELKDKVINSLHKIEGWCSVEKALKLANAIVSTKPKVCVEIGVFGGASIIPMALAAQTVGGHVYGIDPWTTDAATEGTQSDINNDWWKGVDIKTIHVGCLKAIAQNGVANIITLYEEKASDAVRRFEDNSIDFLHIDGNHSAEKTLEDAQLYLPKVTQKGYIWFDDYFWTTNDKTNKKTHKFMEKHCKKVDEIEVCHIFQKKKPISQSTKTQKCSSRRSK